MPVKEEFISIHRFQWGTPPSYPLLKLYSSFIYHTFFITHTKYNKMY